jgi:hypothetical protein
MRTIHRMLTYASLVAAPLERGKARFGYGRYLACRKAVAEQVVPDFVIAHRDHLLGTRLSDFLGRFSSKARACGARFLGRPQRHDQRSTGRPVREID